MMARIYLFVYVYMFRYHIWCNVCLNALQAACMHAYVCIHARVSISCLSGSRMLKCIAGSTHLCVCMYVCIHVRVSMHKVIR